MAIYWDRLAGLLVVAGLLAAVGCSRPSEPADVAAVEGADREAAAEAEAELQRFAFEDRHMGTVFRIVLYAEDAETAEAAAEAAFARVGELDATLSDYDVESELSRLSATAGSGEAVAVSDDLYYMLRRSVEFSLASGGAFDITVGPVVRLWRRARRRGERPDEARLAAAIEATGFRYIELDDERQTARLTAADMRLDLGGIAKGYATDEALAVLRERGIRRALVDGGGDISLGERPPGRDGWYVAVVQPVAGAEGREDDAEPRYLVGERLAVATSGDVFQYVEIDGVRYSHVIDPRTGEPTTTPMAITVIAEDGTTADALASAISVLGPAEGLALAERYGAAAIITLLRDGEVERHTSGNLEEYTLVAESEL